MNFRSSLSRLIWARRLIALAAVIAIACFLSGRNHRASDELQAVCAALRRFDADEAQALLARIGKEGKKPALRGAIAYYTAIARRQQGDVAGAMESLRDARRYGWNKQQVEQQELLLAFQSGDVDTAGPALLEWLSSSPSDDEAAQIYDCLTKGYLAAVRLDEAAYCLDAWLRWRPGDVRPLWLRAEVERAKREDRQLAATYREILTKNPNDAKAHRELGRLLTEQNDAAGAIGHLQVYCEHHPEDDEALVSLAACHRRLGEPRQAERLLDDALRRKGLPPGLRAEALVELGQLQITGDSIDLAVANLREAVRLAPANAAAHYALALALARIGQQQEADRQLADSDRIAAQNERLADLAHEVIAQPKNADLRCEAGQIMLAQGRYQEARAWLLSALHCDVHHTATLAALAQHAKLTGKQARAD